MAIPITIITGFLGSGKTTLILNLLPQLPDTYKLALLKNEFGDVAIDSQLASSASISGVQELLNGCICCNLVGQLQDALQTLRTEVHPDRIIIETSGSALPTTLVLEINRIIRETQHYSLDGVISVIDVQNWTGYEDTSYTAKLQARYTDLIVLNKWELVDERAYDVCLDRIADLHETPCVRSDRGVVGIGVLFGVDGSLAREVEVVGSEDGQHSGAEHVYADNGYVDHGHSGEVEVLSCEMARDGEAGCVDLAALMGFLEQAPKEEVYRIKARVFLDEKPLSSGETVSACGKGEVEVYLLNWAFGRWTFTRAKPGTTNDVAALRMTVITARYESNKWKKKLESGGFLKLAHGQEGQVKIRQIS